MSWTPATPPGTDPWDEDVAVFLTDERYNSVGDETYESIGDSRYKRKIVWTPKAPVDTPWV